MRKKAILFWSLLLLTFFGNTQVTTTISATNAQSARVTTPTSSQLDNVYWVDNISSLTDDYIGFTSPGSSNPTRARYLFSHPGILNSQITSVTLRINFAAHQMSAGMSRAQVSMNNLTCNYIVPWSLEGFGDIQTQYRELFNCLANSYSYPGTIISSNSILSASQDIVLYNRSADAAANLNFVDPGINNFTVSLLEFQGSIRVTSVQAIITYEPPVPVAPVLSGSYIGQHANSVIGHQITLSWPSVPNATQYQIFTGSGNTPIQTLTGTSHTFNQLNGCTPYSYRVKAINSSGSSSFSNTVNVVTNMNRMNQMGFLSTSTEINTSWGSVAGATGYEFRRADNNQLLLSAPANVTSGIMTGLQPGTSFQVRAYALGSGCQANYREALIGTRLAPPTITSAVATGGTTASITCTSVAQGNLAAIVLYDGSTNQPIQSYTLPTLNVPVTYTFNVSSLQPLTTYNFFVIGMEQNGGGASANSNIGSLTTLFGNAPTLTVSNPIPTPTSLIASWNAIPNAVLYELQEIVNGTPTLIASTTQTTFTHANLGYGTAHSYRVRAKDASNNYSPYSLVITKSTIAQVGAPKSGTINLTTESIHQGFFPNPVNSRITIIGIDDYSGVELYDLSGSLVKKLVIDEDGSTDISDVASGSYLLVIRNQNEQKEYPLIKE
jgi:hypothetical protein